MISDQHDEEHDRADHGDRDAPSALGPQRREQLRPAVAVGEPRVPGLVLVQLPRRGHGLRAAGALLEHRVVEVLEPLVLEVGERAVGRQLLDREVHASDERAALVERQPEVLAAFGNCPTTTPFSAWPISTFTYAVGASTT